jgi:hypothetical protein
MLIWFVLSIVLNIIILKLMMNMADAAGANTRDIFAKYRGGDLEQYSYVKMEGDKTKFDGMRMNERL